MDALWASYGRDVHALSAPASFISIKALIVATFAVVEQVLLTGHL